MINRVDWDAELPAVKREMATRWKLTLGAPFHPGGQCSLVIPAVTADGTEAVLKLGWRHEEALHEADGLRVWAGDGAIRLLESAELDGTTALLLERCSPGTPLSAVTAEPEQDVIVANLVRRLGKQPPEGHPFRPLADMCDMWAAGFDRRLAARPDAIDAGLAREGIGLFRALPRNATESVLLCTDLHAENILAAQREPWLVIDPKPYVGDPAYDVIQHLLNCADRLLADPAGLAERVADLAELDAERVTLWLFARCVQESLGWPLLGEVAGRLAP
jgi:streptomycin 6-kinase